MKTVAVLLLSSFDWPACFHAASLFQADTRSHRRQPLGATAQATPNATPAKSNRFREGRQHELFGLPRRALGTADRIRAGNSRWTHDLHFGEQSERDEKGFPKDLEAQMKLAYVDRLPKVVEPLRREFFQRGDGAHLHDRHGWLMKVWRHWQGRIERIHPKARGQATWVPNTRLVHQSAQFCDFCTLAGGPHLPVWQMWGGAAQSESASTISRLS